METQDQAQVFIMEFFFHTSGEIRQSTSCTVAIPCIEFVVTRTAIWQDTELEFLSDAMAVSGLLSHALRRKSQEAGLRAHIRPSDSYF